MKRAAPTSRSRPMVKVRLWTFDQALQRLLPGATSEKLVPNGWHSWTKPNGILQIDDTVEALINRTRSPRIDKSKLPYSHMLAGGCPFFHARLGIATAIDWATRAYAKWPERSSTNKNLLSRYRTSLEAIHNAIPELINLSEQIQSSADHPLAPPLLIGGEKIISAAQQLLWAIENTKFAVDAHRARWINNAPDIWRVIFVGALANSWKQLTSEPAANSEQFKGFVDAAWNSASDSEEDVSFGQAIRYIVKARSRPALKIATKGTLVRMGDPDALLGSWSYIPK